MERFELLRRVRRMMGVKEPDRLAWVAMEHSLKNFYLRISLACKNLLSVT